MRALQDMPISFPGLFGDWSFNPDPIAVHIGHGIYWYGIILAIGLLAGLVLCMKQAKRYGLTEDNVLDMVLWAVPSCIIGARLYYVIFYLDLYRNADGSLNWGEMVAVWDGGLAIYGAVIAGAQVRSVPLVEGVDFFNELERAIRESYPKPKMMILGFPSNPTAQCVELEFFEKVVALAKRYDVLVVHDLAYADIVYDGWKAPSIMQVPGARDVAVEFFTLSKSYNMAGWRIGFMVGNKTLVSALARIKSYHDYGTFTPLQVAAIAALEGDQQCVRDIAEQYKRRRDVLVKGLHEAGWMVEMPKASMYVWAKIPEPYAAMGSLEFAKKLLNEAKVCVSPGIGFGDYGDTHVRFALIENRDRIRQAIRGIKAMFRADGLLPASSKHIHENAE